jgi:hypothetical protein
VSIGDARSHPGRDADCFHDLFDSAAVTQHNFRVPLNAVWTLRDVRGRHDHELLLFASDAPSSRTVPLNVE